MSVIQTVREYELHELLGGGGMGEVFRARHVLLDQPYAVKAVLPSLLDSAEIRARFVREAQTLQRLDHPNILRFVTLFEDSGRLFLVTELLAGKPLDLLVQEGADLAQRADWFHQTVRGVAHAHRRGVLHRDLKPGNLQVLPDGRVKILDFGIARPVAARAITAMGHLVGTPVYLPPEILLGETASSAAGPTWDVYTLGLLAYELFTQRLPFDLDPNAPPLQLLVDLSRFYGKRGRGPELRTQVPELSRPWVEAIDKALIMDPNKRLPDAIALLRLLDAAPPLTVQETQIVSMTTEHMAPEDATGIHVIRNLRPKGAIAAAVAAPRPPPPAPRPAEATPAVVPPVAVEDLNSLTFSTRPNPAGDDTQTLARPRWPLWMLPAGGAFAAGVLVTALFRAGSPSGPVSPASEVPTGRQALEAAATGAEGRLASGPATGRAASDVPTAPPIAASDTAPEPALLAGIAPAVVLAPDAGVMDFEPIRVADPRRPARLPVVSRERDAARARSGREGNGSSPTAEVGVLSVVATPPALVYVGDRYIGESPIRGRLLRPGRYEVKLVRDEQPRPYRRTLTAQVRAGHRTDLKYEEPGPKRN